MNHSRLRAGSNLEATARGAASPRLEIDDEVVRVFRRLQERVTETDSCDSTPRRRPNVVRVNDAQPRRANKFVETRIKRRTKRGRGVSCTILSSPAHGDVRIDGAGGKSLARVEQREKGTWRGLGFLWIEDLSWASVSRFFIQRYRLYKLIRY